MEGRLIPRDFWICVDDLTAKTVKVLLPLYNVFKEAFPNHAKREGYRLDAFQQQLHAIISYAGLIQVCMAISPSIFHFLSATPGARMDYEVEEQADSELAGLGEFRDVVDRSLAEVLAGRARLRDSTHVDVLAVLHAVVL